LLSTSPGLHLSHSLKLNSDAYRFYFFVLFAAMRMLSCTKQRLRYAQAGNYIWFT
jgi:hypothetical protein